MQPFQMNAALTRVGLLFNGREEGQRVFLGSCFCILDAGVFVTAAHCLDDTPPHRLWVNHHGGPTPHLFSRAERVEFVREADVAILVADAPGAKWVQPFGFVQYAANLGEQVCAFGYPIQQFQPAVPAKETPRFFRGNIQRSFIHRSPRSGGASYSAYELSFPCPFGLSGGPVFLADDPMTVLGVVTEDLEVGSTLEEEVVEQSAGRVVRVGTRRVINYGVAANMIAAADVLEDILGRPLPNRLTA